MRMRIFIALLCCLMLSGCQHSASLPAADKVETEDMAERDTVLRTLRHCRWRIRTTQS